MKAMINLNSLRRSVSSSKALAWNHKREGISSPYRAAIKACCLSWLLSCPVAVQPFRADIKKALPGGRANQLQLSSRELLGEQLSNLFVLSVNDSFKYSILLNEHMNSSSLLFFSVQCRLQSFSCVFQSDLCNCAVACHCIGKLLNHCVFQFQFFQLSLQFNLQFSNIKHCILEISSMKISPVGVDSQLLFKLFNHEKKLGLFLSPRKCSHVLLDFVIDCY